MHTVRRRSSILLLPLLVSGLLLFGQDSQQPQQTALEPLDGPFLHKKEPYFIFNVPKKKKSGAEFEAIRKRWRYVDLVERKKADLQHIEDAIAAAKAEPKSDKNDEHIADLEYKRNQILSFYEERELQLEVQGDPKQLIVVRVKELPKNAKMPKLVEGLRTGFGKWGGSKILVDRDTTSGALKQLHAESHQFDVIGRPENSDESFFMHLDAYLVPSRDQTKCYRVYYIHQIPESEFNKNKRKIYKEVEFLASRFRIG